MTKTFVTTALVVLLGASGAIAQAAERETATRQVGAAPFVGVSCTQLEALAEVETAQCGQLPLNVVAKRYLDLTTSDQARDE